MRNLFLWIEYEGTNYQGWQSQAGGATVQDVLERVLAAELGEPVTLHGAGRTDAGVHAMGQAANCFSQTSLPVKAILHRANRALPPDIVVRKVLEAPEEFNARRHAMVRHYRYRLIHRPVAPAFERRTWAHIPLPFDRDRFARAIALFAGKHDFAAFRSSACRAKRTRLTLARSLLTIDGDRLTVDVSCRSFLHNMIRILVGTAIDAARGRVALEDIERLLAGQGDRTQAGRTAPAEGLVLLGIEYAAPYGEFDTI
jgi:tRNA pseudouridine38-40 synthase